MLAGALKRTLASLVKTWTLVWSAMLVVAMSFASAAQARVLRTESCNELTANTPVTIWQDDSVQPKAVAIAIHGIVLHGGAYDAMARDLAKQGFLVMAPDMRGYGRWVSHHDKKRVRVNSPVDYDQSHSDIVTLVENARKKFPCLPVFAIGESLGAEMALHIASEKPELIDGLVLSAPSVKHKWFVADVIKAAPSVVGNPFGQIDLAPHIEKYFSNDDRVTEATVTDPLVRTSMTALELMRTGSEANKCLKYARTLSASVPVLIIQGGADKMVKTEFLTDLLTALPSADCQLAWQEDAGHLLLETPYVLPETMNVVSGWLDKHIVRSVPEASITVVSSTKLSTSNAQTIAQGKPDTQ
ncbi:MAG TPA: alpha/beta fold hydrolase [Oculatellaceae cyanobacterium]